MDPTTARSRRLRSSLPVAALLAAGLLAMAMPAGAKPPPGKGWNTTTTSTTAPSTTTTAPSTTTTTTAPTTTTTAPTTTTTAPAGDPCGAPINKADGSPWECTLAEDFDGTELDRSLWHVQQTAFSSYGVGGECFVDSPNNVSVAGGTLRLTVREEAEPFTCEDPNGDFESSYTAASVSTFDRFSQTYGRFEVRAKFPEVTVKGLQESIWLWPDDALKYGTWPWSGEIDIAEVYHLYYDRAIPYIHYVPDPWWDTSVTNNYCLVDEVWEYHTYVAEWTPERITISYDGQVCVDHVINPYGMEAPAPFDHPFMVALTQALGVGHNAFEPGVTPLPATTEVDYVRVWQ